MVNENQVISSITFKVPCNGRPAIEDIGDTSYPFRSTNVYLNAQQRRIIIGESIPDASKHRTRNKFILARHSLGRLIKRGTSLNNTDVSKLVSKVCISPKLTTNPANITTGMERELCFSKLLPAFG